jgi:hypothetical protein
VGRFRYVAKSMNVVNGLLLAALALVAYYVVIPELNITIRTSLPPAGIAGEEGASQQASSPKPSFPDYVMVSEQNLFHPERRIPPEKKAEPEKKAVIIPKPDLVLYGTLIADDLSIAYIEDRKAPFSTPGRGPRPRQVKKGDNIGGYVLRDIRANSIVLVNGEEQLVVTLDVKDKKRGEAAPAVAPAPAARPPIGAPSAASGAAPAGATAPGAAPAPAIAAAPAAAPPLGSPVPGFYEATRVVPSGPVPSPATGGSRGGASSATAPGSAASGTPPASGPWPPPVRRPPYN